MVQLATARSANAALAKSKPLVAVFVGGTSGIGEYSIQSLCRAYSVPGAASLRIYIVGRNADAARRIIQECESVCPKGDFRFIQVEDSSLLRNVDNVCAEITRLEKLEGVKSEGESGDHVGSTRVDSLILSTGQVDFGGRNETKEGIDKSLSLLYYSRIRFITQLLPLLLSASSPAHVVSVYAAGAEKSGKFHPNDLSLRSPGTYGFNNARVNVVHMKTMAFEHLAKLHPGKLSLVHVYPGLVITPPFQSKELPWWFKAIWFCVGWAAKRWFSIGSEEIGDRITFLGSEKYPARGIGGDTKIEGENVALSTDGTPGGGAYSVNYDGETYDVAERYRPLREDGFEDKVWNHTVDAFQEIEAGRRFKT